MKRLFSFLLALTLLLSLIVPVSAAAKPTVSVQATQSADGSTVTAVVSISASEDLAGLQLTMTYDDSRMTVSGQPKVSGVASSMSYLCNPDNAGAVTLVSFSATGHDNAGGAVMTIQFVVKEGAAGTVNFGFEDVMLVNDSVKSVACTVTPGSATLKAPTTTQEPKPSAPETSDDLEDVSGATQPTTPTDPKPGEESPEEDFPASGGVFTDCNGHWARAYIEEAAALGLVNGMGGTRYVPNGTMTRAQFVTILWRQSGEPEPSKLSNFIDLDPTQTWYTKSIAWAAENNIVGGYGGGRFGPNDPVTREQMIVILHRYAGKPGSLGSMLYGGVFTDEADLSSWARDAMFWGIYEGLYCGTSSVSVGGSMKPKENATRGQIAVVMVKYNAAYAENEGGETE